MANDFFIKADVFGKIKYWDFINGLHGKGRAMGYSMYPSIREANKTIKKLKNLFHDGIEYEVLPHDELPFIKKQILARKRGERICIKCNASNKIGRKFCKKCKEYQS